MHFEPLPQPALGTVSDILRTALIDGRYDTLRAAVAYVTSSGVLELGEALRSSGQTMQWLSAFDWCRSEPAALDALSQHASSEVRVHDGARVVAQQGCVPTVSYHPKAFLFLGPDEALLVLGSANLSRNGLRQGVEFDAVISVSRHGGGAQASWQRIDRVRQWFDDSWTQADPYVVLADAYADEYPRRLPATAVLDYGATGVPTGRRFTAPQLAQVARSQTMWIEAGNLTAAGSASPGHQLMMRPLTRVYFGFGAEPVPPMTRIGEVSIRFEGVLVDGLSLEFAHNSMDRLNLPRPSARGIANYDGATLKFEKAAIGGAVVFDLSVLSASEARRLKNASTKQDMTFNMSSGRTFGFV